MSNFEQALERTDGKTLILSNGSKWAGQDPDSIQTLLDVLGDNVLDPMFEQYHCYRPYPFEPMVRTGRNGEMVEDFLFMFLQLCVAQTKVAFTDNKNWGKIRLYYPMPTVDGFFKPTEVVIKSDPVTADVTIMMASEEGAHLCL